MTSFLSPAKKLPAPELTASSDCLRDRDGQRVTLDGSTSAKTTRACSARALSSQLSCRPPADCWGLGGSWSIGSALRTKGDAESRQLKSGQLLGWAQKRLSYAVPLFSFVLLLSTSACIHGKLPAREFYRLHLPEPTDSIAAAEHDAVPPRLPPGDIAIVPYVAPGVYGDGNIVFRIDESTYGSYPNREWAVPVSTMLGMLTEDVFRSRPLTRDPAVFNPPSPHSYAYVWHGMVRELEEVDRGSRVYAAVRLDARLLRARDDSVLWAGNARLERLVPEGTMPAIVSMLSQLSAEVIVQLQESARASVFGPAASAVRPPHRDSTARR